MPKTNPAQRGREERFFLARFIRETVNEDDRTVELSFSSETEDVDRWFGIEILDHSPGAVRLDRLNDGSPLLVNHDPRDQVGVVENASIGSDRRGRATVRFSRSARADEVFQDVKDGIRTKVSVGYDVHAMILESTEEGQEKYRVTDWEPYEISIVPMPADMSVGVGRAGVTNMNETTATEHLENTTRSQRRRDNQAVEAERERTRSILAIGEKFDAEDLARQFVDNGRGVDQFRDAILERMGGDDNSPMNPAAPAGIGMNGREASQYSFRKAILAQIDPKFRENAGFELECSRAVAEQMRREPQGLFVPPDVLKYSARDLSVGTATAGGHLVATHLMAERFVDMLRNRTLVRQLGATVLTDLVGNLAIPRQTGGATGYWVAEAGSVGKTDQAFDQLALTPHTVAGRTEFSRKLMLQASPDVEGLIRNDLATVIGTEIDRAAINGSGTGDEPAGIISITGVGSVPIGTNGGALTWDHIVDLEGELAIGNADLGALAYLTNAKVRKALKKTLKVSGDAGAGFIWGDGNEAGFGTLNATRAGVSNQVPSNLTKGTGTDLSAVLYGNWADLIIGEWSGLDLLVDPYSLSDTGGVRIVAFQDVDFVVRHEESFAVISDAIAA